MATVLDCWTPSIVGNTEENSANLRSLWEKLLLELLDLGFSREVIDLRIDNPNCRRFVVGSAERAFYEQLASISDSKAWVFALVSESEELRGLALADMGLRWQSHAQPTVRDADLISLVLRCGALRRFTHGQAFGAIVTFVCTLLPEAPGGSASLATARGMFMSCSQHGTTNCSGCGCCNQ